MSLGQIDYSQISIDIVSAIKSSEHIVITSHKSPDGDSIGSSLGMLAFIEALGKKAVICHPDIAPEFLTWLEAAKDIRLFDTEKEVVTSLLNNADLIFCLDYNGSNRLGEEMGKELLNSRAQKIMIDHHLNPEDFAAITLSYPEIGSTSELVLEVIEHTHPELLKIEIGTPLYMGIMTDTGSFRFPSVTARTHYLLGRLLEVGVKHNLIHERIFDTNTVDRLRLRGFALSEKLELFKDFKVALITLTEKELDVHNYKKGDTEGLVNVALSIQGIQAAAFFAEKDGVIKMSFRAKGDYFVNILASENFEGGGHKYAAGGVSKLSMNDTITKFKNLLPKYFAH